mmetsp:Transcript_44225/g.92107  ORF Transcript_44225/g.92107 Transcript_44225/m.92107 type:complete len:388 (-) Transcript_44225:1169-2332(-)
MAATTTATPRDTSPSFGLKLRVYLYQSAILGIIIAFNIGGILFNLAGSRIYVVAFYVSLRLLTPGGSMGSQKTPPGGAWRRFSEHWFFPLEPLRSYLGLAFAEPPREFVEAEAKPGAQFLFAAFPHGIGADYRLPMDGVVREVMPNLVEKDKMRYLAASVLFSIPLVRELCLWTGCIDAGRKHAEAALSEPHNKSLLVLPGGEAEQIQTIYGKEKLYLSKRKGFIKLAMRKGVPVVPMYVFGSSDAYYTFHSDDDDDDKNNNKFDWTFYKLRYRLMKNFGICITVACGLWGNPLCPLPKKMTIVTGRPIRFERQQQQAAAAEKPPGSGKSEGDSAGDGVVASAAATGFEPTTEELDAGHALFVRELTALFDAHKSRLGYGDRTLEVI